MSNTNLISIEKIENIIYLIRGEKVMLDRDLARLYDVSTAALNQAVRRNRERFPADFMFQLTAAEVARLNRSQIVIGSQKHRNPRVLVPMPLPNKAWRCYRACYEVNARWLSISK